MAHFPPTPRSQSALKAPADISLNVLHEIALDDTDDRTIRRLFEIDTPSPKTKILVRSHVSHMQRSPANSPAFLAAVRRNGAARIMKLVLGLEEHVQDEGFAAWTEDVLRALKQLVQTLAEAEELRSVRSEGNSCEILRQLRDTFLNDGWRGYRTSELRQAALAALKVLREADNVSAEDVYRVADSLLDLGIEPAAGALNSDVEEEILD